MKKRFLAYAFLLAAVVSVTSGCIVRDDYGHRRHHNRYNNGYNNGNDNYHNHDRGY
jgi:hypothetical protein